ncbi:Acid_phosphatase [Hexamita inflata]|uniref:Acid phosphatase n=1 Tax=Hexamita inflata TaxID=28002 RepID=A0AA86USM9_9EUKA|nr:Acid phosphatase [Hexamita inflata]
MMIHLSFLQQELQSVFIMTRHGIRTPTKVFKHDQQYWNCSNVNLYSFQYKNEQPKNTELKIHFDIKNQLNGSCFIGQLMDKGFVQHQDLSNLWQELYGELYQYAEFRSTVMHRVIVSLVGQLTNIQNNYTQQILGKSVHNIRVATKHMDSAVICNNCSWGIGYLKNTVKQMNKQKYIKNDMQLDQMLNDFQQKIKQKASWVHIGDHVKAKLAVNYSISALSPNEIQNAVDITDDHWRKLFILNNSFHDTYIKAAIGSLIEYLNEKINTKQATIVSAHDSSLAPLISIIVRDDQWKAGQPGFASFIAIEQYKSDEELYIQIRLRDGSEGKGNYVIQKACNDYKCSTKSFQQYIEQFQITIQERTKLCKETFNETQYFDYSV